MAEVHAVRHGWTKLVRAIYTPVDGAWLAAFRVLFGTAFAISMVRFLAHGWVDEYFVRPKFHFKYWGFGWVEPLPPPFIHVFFVVLAVACVFVTLGLFYRGAAALFAVGFTYLQLLDVTIYLNHYYLATILAWLLAIAPANRTWSIDAWWRRRRDAAKGLAPRPPTLPAGWLYLLRFQVGVVYTFAGLAKAQSDWLLHAQPLRIWLGSLTDIPVLGPLFTIEGVPLFMSWFGFLFDTTIAWFLLYRRTRPYAYVVVIAFHVMTRILFPIGMFPVIMIGGALVFFSPSWPRILFARLRGFLRREVPRESPPVFPSAVTAPPVRFGQGLLVGIGLLYAVVQLALPFRYLAYDGSVLWHEQGMRFSWRVMLRAKGGNTTFSVRQKETGRVWYVHPREYLTPLQESEMSSQPDLILQLAHHIRDRFEARGLGPVEVRAESRAALNGRRSAPLIDPTVDLALVRDGLAPAGWILPGPQDPPPHTRPVL